MKINFNLREVQKGIKASEQKETPINLVLRWNNQRLIRPTGKVIHPHKWNFDKQRANKELDTFSTFNTNLQTIKSDILTAFETFQIEKNHEPNLQEFKAYLIEKLDNVKKPKVEKKIPTLIELTTIKFEMEEKRLVAEGKRTSRATTLYSYRRLKELLIEFKAITKAGIDYKDITMDWYYNFMDFLNSKGYTPNYKGKIVKDITTVLNLANEKGYSTNKVHKNKNFKKVQVKTFHTYLNDYEIEQLYSYDFKAKENFERVRDLFVIACRTGLRISDFKRIKKDHIIKSKLQVVEAGKTIEIEREFLRVFTQKSEKEVDIPLHSNVAEILLKYDFNLPKISDQKFNERIKEVCEKAGINEPCIYNETKGNLTTRKEQPKYELISSHTGRRSFATNHYKQGFPMLSIMAITGHSKVKDFMNYIVLDANEHAKVLASHYYKLEEEKRAAKQHLKLA
tara:strand:- start:200 stop:1558 length:1359 start_codon:yes stop_codon:yes gene_type:complete